MSGISFHSRGQDPLLPRWPCFSSFRCSCTSTVGRCAIGQLVRTLSFPFCFQRTRSLLSKPIGWASLSHVFQAMSFPWGSTHGKFLPHIVTQYTQCSNANAIDCTIDNDYNYLPMCIVYVNLSHLWDHLRPDQFSPSACQQLWATHPLSGTRSCPHPSLWRVLWTYATTVVSPWALTYFLQPCKIRAYRLKT